MYARDVAGQRLTFTAPSTIWKNDMVMQDRETKTFWSHHSLRALQGPLVGHELKVVPHVQTTWAQWKALHPRTLFVDKTDTWVGGNVNLWTPYENEPDLMGQAGGGNPDPRFPGKTLCVGFAARTESVCYPLGEVKARPRPAFLANEKMPEGPVLLVTDPASRTVAAFHRVVAGRELHFDRLYNYPTGGWRMRDSETHSTWEALSGRAIAGTLQGARLPQVPHLFSYWFSWVEHYPNPRLGTAAVEAGSPPADAPPALNPTQKCDLR